MIVIDGGKIVEPGDWIWVLEREDEEVVGYFELIFLEHVDDFVLAATKPYGHDGIHEIMGVFAEETAAEGEASNIGVYPRSDCFGCEADALAAAKRLQHD